MKNKDYYSDLIGKFLAGESSTAEKEELFAWTRADRENRLFFEEIEKIWNLSIVGEIPDFGGNMQDAWSKIDRATGEHGAGPADVEKEDPGPSGKIVPLSKRMVRWSVAAVILLFAGFMLWRITEAPPVPRIVEIRTGENETREFMLPDSSLIWLNEHSLLSYDAAFARRNVTLDGEAFFEVKRMETAPFTVVSGEATTTVLGTSFNVRAYPDENRIEVTVETGKVKLAVAEKSENAVLLPAGSSGVVLREEEKVEKTDGKIENAASWKTRTIFFDETMMKDVIRTLERYFGTNIQVTNESIYDCTYSSLFEQPDLEEILSVVSGTLELDLTRQGNTYLLSGKGCQPEN